MDHIEKSPSTEPQLLSVLNELMAREPIFHRPEFGTRRRDFEAMLDPAFREVGASGRRYSRDYVLDILERRARSRVEDPWETTDFHCLKIATDNYLLIYTLMQGARVTRRSTIWRRTADGWKILFHQGTVVSSL